MSDCKHRGYLGRGEAAKLLREEAGAASAKLGSEVFLPMAGAAGRASMEGHLAQSFAASGGGCQKTLAERGRVGESRAEACWEPW